MSTQRCAHRNHSDYSVFHYDPATTGALPLPLIPMDGYRCLTLILNDLSEAGPNYAPVGLTEIAVGDDSGGADLAPITADISVADGKSVIHLSNLHKKFVRVTATAGGVPGFTMRAIRSNVRESSAIDKTLVADITCDKTA